MPVEQLKLEQELQVSTQQPSEKWVGFRIEETFPVDYGFTPETGKFEKQPLPHAITTTLFEFSVPKVVDLCNRIRGQKR